MKHGYLVVLGALGLVGCAHGAPPELRSARDAQRQLSSGDLENAAPEDVFLARRSLRVAEAAFEEEGDTAHSRALAYVALRRAQRAVILYRVSADETRLAALEQHAAEPDTRLAEQSAPGNGPLVMPQAHLAAK